MGLLGWIIVGFIAGAIGSRVAGIERAGCVTTTIIGVVGAVLGGALFNKAGSHGLTGFTLWSMFVAIVGATLLLLVLGAIAGRGRPSRPRR